MTLLHVGLFILFAIVLFALGAIFHAWILTRIATTKTDLSTWSNRLRSAIAQDEKTSKAAVERIALEIATTKTDLSTWSNRLRLAIAQDEKTSKAAVERIALEIEQRL